MLGKTGTLKGLCLFICASMIVVTVATSLKQNLFDVLPRLIHDPWTVATFIDFYFNILILSAWMAYKENNGARAVLWFTSFLALGSIATSYYVLVQIWKMKPHDSIEKVLVR